MAVYECELMAAHECELWFCKMHVCYGCVKIHECYYKFTCELVWAVYFYYGRVFLHDYGRVFYKTYGRL